MIFIMLYIFSRFASFYKDFMLQITKCSGIVNLILFKQNISDFRKEP